MAEGDIRKGIVKWYHAKKGFGFIIPDDGSRDVFVHHLAIKKEGFRSLADGESVEFEVKVGEDGLPKASNVTGPGGAPVQGRKPRASNGDKSGGGGGGGN